MTGRDGAADELKVFITHNDAVCGVCGEELMRPAWLTLDRGSGAVCLTCSDLDHLVLLPPGDAALTRRAKKESRLWAVVLRFSRTRGRYERQGLLVEPDALDRAEASCLADADLRERRRERAAERRAEVDEDYVRRFAAAIRAMFPGCPPGREDAIAAHACARHSGRVGRSEAAREVLAPEAVRLATVAHLRHTETDYDERLMAGAERDAARAAISAQLAAVVRRWEARGGQ